jgi:gliding motility-associated-like protein
LNIFPTFVSKSILLKSPKRFLFYLLLGFPGIMHAQKEANNWYFGNSAGVTFASGSPQALTNGKLVTDEGCATISNSKGRLLFYTDGVNVWDSTHNKTPNGNGSLNGHSSASQSAVVIPRPDSIGQYYIFTVDQWNGSKGLCYSQFKMSLNSGKGDVVSSTKNTLLLKVTCEKITAVKHSNGRDYWVIANHYGSDSMYSYLVTPAGLSSTVVHSRTGFKIAGNTLFKVGCLKVSPNGRKIAYTNSNYDTLAVGDFNPSNGSISNVWTKYIDDCYGVEFSMYGNFLYVGGSYKYVYQLNANATSKSAFISSQVKIDSFTTQVGAFQIGPDGKIYISRYDNTYLDVIHYPDSSGKSCKVSKNSISLMSKKARYGVPSFIQSFFKSNEAQYKRNCVNDSTFVWPLYTSGLDSVKWDFGDTASGSSNISRSITKAYHIYKKAGTYKVKLYSYFKTNSDTTIITIPIKNPKPFIGNDTMYCNGFSRNLLPQKNYIKYKWNNGDTLKTSTIKAKGTYILTATDSAKCIVSDTIVIKNPIAMAKFTPNDTSVCKNYNLFQFKNTSVFKDDELKSLVWKLSDNTSYTDTVFEKSFSTADSFIIRLSINSKNGCKDSLSKAIFVHPNSSIGFSINKTPQCFNGHDFVLTNNSTVSKGSFSNYWKLGDGDTSITKDISSKKYKQDSSFNITLLTTTDKNCKDTLTKTVVVNPSPKSVYTINQVTQCFTYNSYDFTNSSTIRTGSIASQIWDFGDTKTATTKDITKQKYATVDSFSVMLLNISDQGCRDSVSKKVYVNPNTTIGFSINKTPQCYNGHDFVFTNSSAVSKGTLSYDWNFGDGNTATTQDIASKKYSIDSSYKVTLVTTTDKGCKDTVAKTVVVNPNPKAGFGINQITQCFKWNSYDYTNSSTIRTGSIASTNWQLGDSDNRSSKDIKAKHYSTEDSFKVDLLTVSNNACRDSISKWVYLLNSPKPDFAINKDTQCFNGHSFTYQNNTTIAKGTYSSLWQLGDATTNTNKDVSTKQYSVYGNYNILLILTSNNNCKDSIQKKIRINPNAANKFIINKDRQCFRGNNFNFTNQSTIAQGTITYNWNLGDAKTFTTKDVSNYKYATEDSFNVRLITTSDKGCKDTLSKMVVTFAQPIAKFTVPQDSQCWQKHFYIINNATTLKYGTMSHVWDFGDGTKDFSYTPSTKKYQNKSANYTLKYKVTSDHGCTDSAQKKISLLERPISTFSINDSIQCFSTNSFSFTNKTTFSDLTTLSYIWNYGDGSKTTGKVPKSLSYPAANYYTVQLIASSYLNNCVDTLNKIMVVAPHATPDYSIDNDSQCLRTNKFTFTNLSKVKFGTLTYNWNFGDNTKDTAANPAKKYNNGSNYSVKLVATTNYNCKDSISKPLVLIPHPKSNFTVNDSTLCKVQSLGITNKTTVLYGTFNQVWHFDEGADETTLNINSKKLIASGFHPVRLAVISNFGCTDTITKRVFVEQSATTKISIVENDSQCLRGNKTQFNVFSQGGIISLSSYTWQFGDGNSSTIQNPTHTYNTDSSFKVSAETVSSNGCLDTAYFDLVIHPHPVSDFTATSPCFPNPVVFTNTSKIKKGSIVSQHWDLDGSTSTLLNPTTPYVSAGTYTIKLKNKSNYGCTDSITKQAIVKARPSAKFSYTQLPSADEIKLQLNNQSSTDVITNNWDFGDGTLSQEVNPIASYKDTGRFNIILEVINSDGCKDTFKVKTDLFYPDFVIYLPNIFSPNGNGVNDVFRPLGSQYNRKYTMEIYNRWGEKIFETHDVSEGWDGKYKGQDCQDGIYHCYVHILPVKGPLKSYYSGITLLR